MDIILAAVVWACEPMMVRNKLVYGNCGYHEAELINLPCREQTFKEEITGHETKHIYCLNPEYFPEMRIHIVPNNVG